MGFVRRSERWRRSLHRQLNPPVAGSQPVSGSLRVMLPSHGADAQGAEVGQVREVVGLQRPVRARADGRARGTAC